MNDIDEVPLSKIRLDGGTQSRTAISADAVRDYAEAMDAGADFPPGEAVFDGKHYWLWDGFHRYHGETTRKKSNGLMLLRIQPGTLDDALWLSVGANKTHGLKRTNADKRRAVEMALKQRPQMSDRVIAEHCGVDHKTVATLRPPATGELPQSNTRTGKDGRTRKVPEKKPATSKPAPPTETTETIKPVEAPKAEAPAPAVETPKKPVKQKAAPEPPASDYLEPDPDDEQRFVGHDELGIPLSTAAAAAWEVQPLFRQALREAAALARTIDTIAHHAGGILLKTVLRGKAGTDKRHVCYSHDLANCVRELRHYRPYTGICPECHARSRDNDPKCLKCKGLPYVNKSTFATAPEKQRVAVQALREVKEDEA